MNTNLQTTSNRLMLDFHQKNYQTVLAKEYDKGSRFIPIQCMEYGEPFTLDSSIEIQVKVLTPDNRALLEHSATIQDDGSILLELTENMLYYPGKATVELIFYDFEHKKRLSPMKFDLLIDSSAYPDDRVISSDEFNALTDLLEKATADYTYVITAARESADAAKISEDNAASSADIASTKAAESNLSALNAQESADSAAYSASCAYHSETASANSAAFALNSAKEAESWTHGNTGIREGENTNNSKYWSEQSKEYSNSWKGSLLPQGTIAFSQIPTNGNIAGHMYNINEAFVTDSRFKDDTGYSYPAGTNIYWTQDGKWDCLSGTLTMTLTQAEYDNFSNAEKMNGTIYYISDADNSIGNANGNLAGLMSPEDKEKLDGIENNAEVNVQSDWNVSNSNSDAYIKNKPQAMKNPTSLNILLNGISQGSYDGSSQKNVNVTAENVGADSSGTAETKVLEHNTSETAHADIRNLITTLTTRLNTLADSDDTTLDQLSEIVAYIKSNRGLIENVTTNKVNITDIIDNLTSSVTNKPLAAKQGKVLKDLIDTLTSTVEGKVNKAGDTMTGDLVVSIQRANANMSVPCAGRIDSTTLIPQGLSECKTFLGSIVDENSTFWNIISTRHGNGYNDGRYFGMYIRSLLLGEGSHGGSLLWNKQMGANKGWLGERVLLDSVNYKDFCLPLSGDIGNMGVPYGLPATASTGTPIAGGSIVSDNLIDLSNYRSFIGTHLNGENNWNHVISTRHHNGWGDGTRYGMYLRAPIATGEDNNNLYWRVQNTSWFDERILLDSYNYKKYCLPLSGGSMNQDATLNFTGSGVISTRITMNADDSNVTITPAYLEAYRTLYDEDGNNPYNYRKITNITPSKIDLINVEPDGSDDRIIIENDYIKIIDNEWSEEFTINSDGIKSNSNLYIRVDNGGNYYIFDSDNFRPVSNINNAFDLGLITAKWRNIYAQNGVIQTSDRTKKTNINSLEAQKVQAFINGLNPVSYKMLDGTSGRTHYGFIAQDIEELMKKLDMDSKDFAGFIKSPKKVIRYEDENGKKLENPIEEVIEGEYDYALRYDEFIAPLIAVVQEQQKIIENQQKEIKQIKNILKKL